MLDSGLRWLARTIDANARRISIACLLVAALARLSANGLTWKLTGPDLAKRIQTEMNH